MSTQIWAVTVFLLISFIFLTSLKNVDGLKCKFCFAEFPKEDDKEFCAANERTFSMDCTDPTDVCLWYHPIGQTYVYRKCGQRAPGIPDCRVVGGVRVCYCNTDDCNDAEAEPFDFGTLEGHNSAPEVRLLLKVVGVGFAIVVVMPQIVSKIF